MIKRILSNEMIELFSRASIWAGLLFASILLLVGLNQLDLDSNKARILILDQSETQSEGRAIEALVKEIAGVQTTVASRTQDVVDAIDRVNPQIILSRSDD